MASHWEASNMALMSIQAVISRRRMARGLGVEAIVDMQLSGWLGRRVVLLAMLAVSACGSDSTLSTERRDTKPVGDQHAVATTADRRAVEASVPLPRPVSAASLYEYVGERALRLSQLPYVAYEGAVPDALARLDYAQYRSIEFRPEAAMWRGETLFELQFFHPGFIYRQPVRIHTVEDGRIEELHFDRASFRYPASLAVAAEALTPELGYAGFRAHYPLESPDRSQEVAVFLGASYFRLVGSGQVHGLSGRGLAVDVVPPGNEEFPVFREFWLLRPTPSATSLVFFALLDSPAVTGAYRFDLQPGAGTVLRVDVRLHARRDIAKLGVAPLTSMFLYGPNRARDFDDYRPQVHDSDGLLMRTGTDEWILRPLSNRRFVRVTSLRDRDPRGFGLVQRERRFDGYLDLEANYQRRPSLWVGTEDAAWGEGGVELVEIPTSSEFNDNIVAYWAPEQPFLAGETRRYRYRLATFDRRLEAQSLMQVERTRVGWDALPGQSEPPPRTHRRFVIDFSGAADSALEGEQSVAAVLEISSGQASDPIVQALPDGAGWRATFDLIPDGANAADMRLFLTADGARLSETWTYVWYPDSSP